MGWRLSPPGPLGRALVVAAVAGAVLAAAPRAPTSPGGWASAGLDGGVAQATFAGGPAETGAVAPFRATGLARERAARCLAEALYYEAAHEPRDGQRAIAQVILNRSRDPNFPPSVCGVVYQGAERDTGCQFSFACDGSRDRRPPSTGQWLTARRIAEEALDGKVMAEVGTATHYHAVGARAWWAPSMTEVAHVGRHVFYRWKGTPGEARALARRSRPGGVGS